MSDIILQLMTRALCHQLYKGWENDQSIYADMSVFTEYRYDESRVDRYFDAKNEPSRKMFAIMKDGAPIGELQLKRIDTAQRECTLSIHMQNDSYKGKGYGTQAEALALKYAFEYLNMNVVYADTILKNTSSQHVLQKVGFEFLREENGFRYYVCRR